MRILRQNLAWILCIAPVVGLLAPADRIGAGESGKPGAQTPRPSPPPAANHASKEVQKAIADLRTGSVGVVARGGSRGDAPLTVYLFMDENNGGEELLKYATEKNVCYVAVDTGAVSGAALLAADKFHWNSWWYVGAVMESGRPDSEEALRALVDRVLAKQSLIRNIVKTADAVVGKMKSREVTDALAAGAGIHRALGTDTVVVVDGVNYAGPLSKAEFEAIVKYHLGEALRKQQEALRAAMPGVKPLVIGKATFYLPTMADIVGPVPCIEKPITSIDDPDKQKAIRAIAVGPFDPVYGNSVNPELTVFIYNDYDCPWCFRFIDVMHGMKDMPPGNVRWVVKETTRSALGAMAAQKMGVYDPYVAEVRKSRLDTRRLENVRLVAEKIEGLDVEAFMDLAKSPEVEAAVRDNARCKGAGLEKGSWGAPSFTTDAGGGYPGYYSRVKMSRIIAYELWQKKRLSAGEERAPRPADE